MMAERRHEMSQKKQDSEKAQTTKRKKMRVWLAAIIVVLTAIVLCLLWSMWNSESLDEQLGAIEAARAIPDSENAAVIYNQLLADYNEAKLSPALLDPNTDDLTLIGPWSSKDYPEVAQWIMQQQGLITRLLEATRKDKCSFSVYDPGEGIEEHIAKRVNRIKTMRKWARLVVRAANNDVAEGRIARALENYFCAVRMGEHARQQPIAIDFLTGIGMETLALQKMRIIIMESDVTEEHLKTIEATLPQTSHNWTEDSQTMLEVERLYSRKMPPEKVNGLLNQLKAWLRRSDESAAVFNRVHEIYLQLFAERRGNRILVSLRRYKNKHGRWPQTLDEIQSQLPAEVLVDPSNNGPFVYKLTDDSFTLYSKGPNELDENGKRRDGRDDCPIWTPPSGKQKTKQQSAEPNESNANTEPIE
jgi:hypothetical protein